MALKSEKDRAKAQQDKFQAILSALLKDEDNKYCEDCDAKGPRWASWNLGVFLCIRCAGIHRNLGVHISRVKSVNLDSWTPEQVAMMQEIGNSRARAVYEANVPDAFRRPQTDSALEAFIRAKYEQKKYIAKEWVPPKPVVPKEWLEDDKSDKRKARSKPASSISLNSGPPSAQSSVSSGAPSESKASAKPTVPANPKPAQPEAAKPKSSSDDLLGLDADVPQTSGGGSQGGDLLADIFGGANAGPIPQPGGTQQDLMASQQNGTTEANLFDSGASSSGEGLGEKKSAKDSIMALYGSGGGQQQVFGVPEMASAGSALGTCLTEGNALSTSTTAGMSLTGVPYSSSGYSSSTLPAQMFPTHGMMLDPTMMASQERMMPPGTGMMTGMMQANTRVASANPAMMPTGSGIAPVSAGVMGVNMAAKAPASNSSVSLGLKPSNPGMAPGLSANAGKGPGVGYLGTALPVMAAAFSQAGPQQGANSNPKLVNHQKLGMMTASAGMSANTTSVPSHTGSVSATKPQAGNAPFSGMAANNPFMFGGGEYYQSYSAAPNLYYMTAAGGMYMPQQQMFGAGAMPLQQQQQQGMMGIQQGMMGQPAQQGMMGMQQQPGAMFGGAGTMGQNPMGNPMMGSTQSAGGMMARPGGQMFMQQQQANPIQQQMQFQQMQQQMANMSVGGTGQMGGMQQPPQQAAVGGASWGGAGTGHTLSNNLWQ